MKSILVLHFEGAPVHFETETSGMRDYLADVLEEGAESFILFEVFNTGRPGEDVTSRFMRDWAKAYDFGSGDERGDILSPYPGIIRAFFGDELVAEYRSAQEAS